MLSIQNTFKKSATSVFAQTYVKQMLEMNNERWMGHSNICSTPKSPTCVRTTQETGSVVQNIVEPIRGQNQGVNTWRTVAETQPSLQNVPVGSCQRSE